LIRTLSAVNRQAKAADRQAAAAEEQVAAAKAATTVSDAQRVAAEQGAAAEREHSELIREQLLATLRPILVIVRHEDKLGGVTYLVENHGEGVALSMKANYRGRDQDASLSLDVLGPNHSAIIGLNFQEFQADGVYIHYESQDGRFFVTTAFAAGSGVRQTTIEVDAGGGHLPQPRIAPGNVRKSV